MGFSDVFDGTTLASLHDVIIVVPNYRVGVFGFFSLGKDSVCKGNAGLLDQVLSLQLENFLRILEKFQSLEETRES